MVVRLAMWSGPRNISTAMMRSWENRDDAIVVDEPFYAHFLSVTGRDDPGRDEVIAAGETDWRRVVEHLLGPLPQGTRVFYQKHMPLHLTPQVDHGWIADLTNVLLIRDPREVVASYVKQRPQATVEDIGVLQQRQLYEELAASGSPPLVIESADFLQDPQLYQQALCERLGVEFSPAMLSWPEGIRASDGVWGRYWYESVRRSTGFAPYQPRSVRMTGAPAELAAQCMPAYEQLHDLRWRP